MILTNISASHFTPSDTTNLQNFIAQQVGAVCGLPEQRVACAGSRVFLTLKRRDVAVGFRIPVLDLIAAEQGAAAITVAGDAGALLLNAVRALGGVFTWVTGVTWVAYATGGPAAGQLRDHLPVLLGLGAAGLIALVCVVGCCMKLMGWPREEEWPKRGEYEEGRPARVAIHVEMAEQPSLKPSAAGAFDAVINVEEADEDAESDDDEVERCCVCSHAFPADVSLAEGRVHYEMCIAQAAAEVRSKWVYKCKWCKQPLPSKEVASLHQTYCTANPAMFDATALTRGGDNEGPTQRRRRRAGSAAIRAESGALEVGAGPMGVVDASFATEREELESRLRGQKQRRFWKKGDDEEVRGHIEDAARKSQADKWLKAREQRRQAMASPAPPQSPSRSRRGRSQTMAAQASPRTLGSPSAATEAGEWRRSREERRQALQLAAQFSTRKEPTPASQPTGSMAIGSPPLAAALQEEASDDEFNCPECDTLYPNLREAERCMSKHRRKRRELWLKSPKNSSSPKSPKPGGRRGKKPGLDEPV